MKYLSRSIEPEIRKAFRNFAALIVTGPRRSGKTTLLKRLFPAATYRLLEDPDMTARFRSDARAFLEEIKPPAILDEIQNVPEILNYVRARIDHSPNRKGQWILTGSQEAPLMKGVTESMAGRAAVFHLLPFSIQESEKVSLLRGGFPEVLARPSIAGIWFRSYLQTYLERDVRAISPIHDLSTFRRFLSLLASRCGQIVNRTGLAAPLGVSVPTISAWLNILEMTSQIILVPPFFENFGKRLIKSPKLYFLDSGLACELLSIDSEKMLNQSPFLGPLFEGFVASEILKHQTNRGFRREIYFFRDQQGLEIDFLVLGKNREVLAIEAKANRTVKPEMARPILRFKESVSGYGVRGYVVHRSSREEVESSVLYPAVRAITPKELIMHLSGLS